MTPRIILVEAIHKNSGEMLRHTFFEPKSAAALYNSLKDDYSHRQMTTFVPFARIEGVELCQP